MVTEKERQRRGTVRNVETKRDTQSQGVMRKAEKDKRHRDREREMDRDTQTNRDSIWRQRDTQARRQVARETARRVATRQQPDSEIDPQTDGD